MMEGETTENDFLRAAIEKDAAGPIGALDDLGDFSAQEQIRTVGHRRVRD
jgi:hypothetical protein